ncbi:hypothetical protein HELRODRAFT_188186 [Helobdella robusta]|uniref:LanC-like protein 2 n=1 Tax=Helobdella robusta TaxID=6412 RepID=T1FPR2_HELRO|nr:hypothetical protein HELRODRAFT_188186 [Helobdella robusta]ESO05815.1 hypothetical protein HELRODRAFT_188186 [Helobdella robusta]
MENLTATGKIAGKRDREVLVSPAEYHHISTTTKHFVNKFSDYCDDGSASSTSQLLDSSEHSILRQQIKDSLKKKANELLSDLENNYKPQWNDFSVYTGSAGLALLYFEAYEKLTNDEKRKQDYLETSTRYLNKSLEHMHGSEVTFLCGNAGPMAVGTVVFHHAGINIKSEQCLDGLLSLCQKALNEPNLPNELLYGRAGYLYSLMFVEGYLGFGSIDTNLLAKLGEVILTNGKMFAKSHQFPCPLMYEWYNTLYLGTAHGITGILYMLLKLKDRNLISLHWHSDIKETIDYLMTLKYPSGNYPAAIEDNSVDELVHWCHGAPGWLYMFLAAHKSFGSPRYLQAAEECGDVVWQRGLLKKGYGICHGVAGNAFCFLALYNATNKEKHLHRALKFAEFIFEYGKHGCRIADTPYSLFEGMAGTIYFLMNVMHPKYAKFPAFEI